MDLCDRTSYLWRRRTIERERDVAEPDGQILRALLDAAILAAQPAGKFDGRLPERPNGRTIVVGAGKASSNMATAFEAAWGPCEGLVVTRYGHRTPTRFVEIVEASHPVPDEAGLAAAGRILELARSAGPDDLVVCLMSGGASALLTRPADGVSFEAKQALNRALLTSGAPIHAMNGVRKALSAIKGGRLAAAAAPARLVTYLISDVPGDDPAVIGSGPTIPDATGVDEVLRLIDHYGVTLSGDLVRAMRANAIVLQPPGGEVYMLATPKMALDAAARTALDFGITPVILGDAIEGEARELGTVMAGIARSAATHGLPAGAPCVLLSGGEATVTLRGRGRGGRNSEFLLSFLIGAGDVPGIAAIACDTDGIDGVEDNAGAWIDAGTLRRAADLKLDPRAFLSNNDSYSMFEALGLLIHTGPTFTNVNDFRAVIVR